MVLRYMYIKIQSTNIILINILNWIKSINHNYDIEIIKFSSFINKKNKSNIDVLPTLT